MKEIELQFTLYQIRAYKLVNKKVYFDIFFSNSRIRSKDIEKDQFMIQEKFTLKNYVGDNIEIWLKDSETRELLGCCKIGLKQGQFNCQLMADQYTKVAELIFKLDIKISNIDRELIIENDEDFIKKVEKQDDQKEKQEEIERARLQQIKDEEVRKSLLEKKSDILLTNKLNQEVNIF